MKLLCPSLWLATAFYKQLKIFPLHHLAKKQTQRESMSA